MSSIVLPWAKRTTLPWANIFACSAGEPELSFQVMPVAPSPLATQKITIRVGVRAGDRPETFCRKTAVPKPEYSPWMLSWQQADKCFVPKDQRTVQREKQDSVFDFLTEDYLSQVEESEGRQQGRKLWPGAIKADYTAWPCEPLILQDA